MAQKALGSSIRGGFKVSRNTKFQTNQERNKKAYTFLGNCNYLTKNKCKKSIEKNKKIVKLHVWGMCACMCERVLSQPEKDKGKGLESCNYRKLLR